MNRHFVIGANREELAQAQMQAQPAELKIDCFRSLSSLAPCCRFSVSRLSLMAAELGMKLSLSSHTLSLSFSHCHSHSLSLSLTDTLTRFVWHCFTWIAWQRRWRARSWPPGPQPGSPVRACPPGCIDWRPIAVLSPRRRLQWHDLKVVKVFCTIWMLFRYLFNIIFFVFGFEFSFNTLFLHSFEFGKKLNNTGGYTFGWKKEGGSWLAGFKVG